jgi:hypothetical protein
LGFRLPHQGDKHFAFAPTLATKAAHNLGEVLVQFLSLRLQRRARGWAV